MLATWSTLQSQAEPYVIGYSFGGVLLRLLLAEHPELRARRLVLLASPLKAMRLSQRIQAWRSYRWTSGECGQLVAEQEAMQAIPMPSQPTALVYGTWPMWVRWVSLQVLVSPMTAWSQPRKPVLCLQRKRSRSLPAMVLLLRTAEALDAMRAWLDADHPS